MAHIEKFAKNSVGHLFAHFERKKENGEFVKFSNQEIDTTKTDQNYNLAWNRDKKQYQIYKDRLSQVQVFNRNDVKTLCSCVTTIPQDTYLKFKDNPKAIREFFEHSYKFLENRYGKQNVVSSFVHMDETTPHMHFAFIPVVFDKKKNIEKVCAKEVITKTELKTFHKDYQEYLDNNLSYDCLVHTGITKENKTIKELKDDTIRNYFVSQKNTPILKDNQKSEDKLIQKVEVKKIPFLGEMVKKSDYDKLKSNFKKLNVKNSSLSEKIGFLKANNEKLTQDIAELKKGSKNIKITRLRENLINSSNEIEFLKSDLSQKDFTIKCFKDENKTIKELKDDTIRNYFVSQKNTPILKDNQKSEDKLIQKVEVKKIPFLGEMVKKSDYDKLKSNFKKLNVKNSSLSEKIGFLKANNEKLTQDIAELKKGSKNIKITRLRENLINSSNEIEFLKSDLSQKDFTIKCFKDENKELKESFKGAINEISKLNETLENFEKFIYYKTLDSSYNYYFFVENLNHLCDKSINSYLHKKIKSLNFKNLNLEQCKEILNEHEILKIRQVEITNFNKRDIQDIDDAVFEMTNNKSFETLDERINRYKAKVKPSKSIAKKSRDFSL